MNQPTAERRACPDPETLVAFDQGRLPDPDLEAVAGHLSVCPACLAALRGLQRPDRDEPGGGPPGPDWSSLLGEPGWARLMSAAEALGEMPGSQLSTDAEPAHRTPREGQHCLGLTVRHYVLQGKIGQGGVAVV